jgi:GT2 family glycosyltransferase/glycosyltransferase involved in cell wall biosynthesis
LTVSVAIPVLNGERYLEEVLAAVAAQELDDEVELVVIDSGSTDRSPEIARAAGATLIRIPPEEFGHGRTRNLAVLRSSGHLIAFLTQDATPAGPGWLAAHLRSFTLAERVGVSFGPHLPRPDASPLTKRLLGEFFHDFSPDGAPVLHRAGDTTYLSSNNLCLARAAWQEVPFRDIPFAEDQALGADLLAAGWVKVFNPDAVVVHSHDHGLVDGFRRYFDEYRGLRDSVGQKSAASAGRALSIVRRSVAADRAYLASEEPSRRARARWTAQSIVHHSGRVVFGGLGEHADLLRGPLRSLLSLDRRGDGVTRRVAPAGPGPYEAALEVFARGVEPLGAPSPFDETRESLELAWVVPPFGVGSGGQMNIFRIMRELERRGHRCSLWVHDPEREEPHTGAALRRRIERDYGGLRGPVEVGFGRWSGCDVAVATGWQTAFPVVRLPRCRARAYLVQDHEPDFYATSTKSLLAEQTYRLGMPCMAGSPGLAELLRTRYGARAAAFEFGVDPAEYHPLADVPRRSDTVCFYAREFTPRRAVELGLMALELLRARRPGLRIVLFGTHNRVRAPFAFEQLGVEDARRLRQLYCEATVGLSLSLTNYSLIPNEMMACGLPVVELAGRTCESVYGSDGSTITLARDDPVDIAGKLESLLGDGERRKRLSRAGREFVRMRTWEAATDVVEAALREALAERARATSRPLSGYDV